MTSRLTSDAFMPSVPIEIPSLTVMVPNSNGVPRASRTPCLTRAVSRLRCTLQGVTSLARLAMPTKGLLSAASSRPVARSMARAGVRAGPVVISRLLCLRLLGPGLACMAPPVLGL